MYRIALEAVGLLAGPIADLPTLERLKAAVEERLPRKPSPQQTSSLEAWRRRRRRELAAIGPHLAVNGSRARAASFSARCVSWTSFRQKY
jgi:hypothetical protein